MENKIGILVIENEVFIAETIRLMLEDFGYYVAGVCYSYDQAVEAVSMHDYDLLLTDIDLGDGMTHRSGFRVIDAMQALKKVPIIFLTAFDDQNTIQQAISYHPSAYLTKPIKASNLYASVQIAVDNFKTQQVSTGAEKRITPDYLYTKIGHRMIKVNWSDVFLLESIKNYVLLRTPAYTTGIPIRSSLSHVVQEMIPAEERKRFVRLNRSMVIDQTIIKSYSNTQVETTQGVFKCSSDFRERMDKTHDGLVFTPPQSLP